jgi:hypothetical protein
MADFLHPLYYCYVLPQSFQQPIIGYRRLKHLEQEQCFLDRRFIGYLSQNDITKVAAKNKKTPQK